MTSIKHDTIIHDLKIQIVDLQDENAYLKMQLEQLRKISIFYENELQKILDHEDFENLMKDCMHTLLLDPHKYEYDEDEDDEE